MLFDLDGVVVDSRVPIARSINFALAALGLPAQDEEFLHRYIGPPLHAAFREILGALGGDPDRAAEAVASYRRRYAEASLHETTLVPGIGSALREAAARWPLAVATSKPTAYARPILEALGVADRFRAIVGPGLDPRGEPKSETVARALDALGIGGGPDVALVGDRHHDVEAALTQRCVAIGVTWGIGSELELRESGAQRLVHAPEALVACLEAL